ncbi:hypothetical protein LIER_43156 [Lithospermum erythrorhizon]|uniref:Uncharacterized protein n=1 Tax=Lithospermum erythrorhizon TaxID=34254 RepID=A0AAV3PNQ2_LITER
MNDCASEYIESENLEDAAIGAPVLVLELPIEQRHEEQLLAKLLQSDLSPGAASAEQPSSLGVIGSEIDSGDGAKVPELEMG